MYEQQLFLESDVAKRELLPDMDRDGNLMLFDKEGVDQMQKKKIYPLDSTIEKWFEAYLAEDGSSTGLLTPSLASGSNKVATPPMLDFGLSLDKHESKPSKGKNQRVSVVVEQAEEKRQELFCRLVILKKERIKSVSDTLEINEIVTKIKCLNALINRIKYGPRFVPKAPPIDQLRKPSKNGFISDRTYSFLN